MTLVRINPPLAWPGFQNGDGGFSLANLRLLDVAGEYDGYVINAREDMTISHVGLQVTATGSPVLDIRIETVSTSDGFATGTLWGTNTNIVTAALSGTVFTLYALTAPASIGKGQVFAVRANYVSGTSASTRHCGVQPTNGIGLPYEIYNVGTPTRGQITVWQNWVLGSSAASFYHVLPFLPVSTTVVTALTNASSAKRGARFRVPFKCRCVGLRHLQLTTTNPFNVLIMDDSGAELGGSSTAFLAIQKANATGSFSCLFDNSVILNPGTWYRAAVEPTSAAGIRMDYGILPDANYRMAYPGGMDFYLAEYTTAGGWVDSTDKVPVIDLLIDQLDDDWSPPTYISGVA